MRRLWSLLLAALAGGAGSVQAQDDPDAAAWAAARARGTAEACQSYLERYPLGRHAEEAFRCVIEGLPEVGPAPAPGVPPAAELY